VQNDFVGGMKIYTNFSTKGERLPGRGKYKWGDNIKMDLRDTGCRGVKWTSLIPVTDFHENY
jgi:hypothetical protein